MVSFFVAVPSTASEPPAALPRRGPPSSSPMHHLAQLSTRATVPEDMRTLSPGLRVLAAGLRFPEGPVSMADGSVLVVEMAGGTLTRIAPDGAVDRIAELGGGPNGAATGADGAVYVANNGGAIRFRDRDGSLVPDYAPDRPPGAGGSIQRVDLESGTADTLYEACDGRRLNAPNDLAV